MTSRSMKEETGGRFDEVKSKYDEKCGMVGRVDDFINLLLDRFEELQNAEEQK